MGNKDDPNQLPNPPKTLNIESKCETPNNGGESSKIGASADGIVRGAGHDKHIMEEDDTLVGFDSPKVYSESEISAGTDLGTDIGKTAAGDPRGVGHDKHIMEEEEEVISSAASTR